MSVTLPANARGPVLELLLAAAPVTPPKEEGEDESVTTTIIVAVRNSTTGKSLKLLLGLWEGDDLTLDFSQRTIQDQTGADRSALLDPADNEVWTHEPLIAGSNAVTVEVTTGPEQGWLLSPEDPRGIAVDGDYVYWADNDSDSIGRANLDGTAPDPEWISGLGDPRGVAVDSSYVYWADVALGAASRVRLQMPYSAKAVLRWEKGYY